MNKKEFVCQAIEEKQQFFNAVSDEVWGYAEAGMKEYQSAECLEKAARELGFSVETGLSGIPTAFVASWGSGKPVIAYLGEYDALPGLSQKAACPVKDELSPGAYGHGCGHNCLGTAALAAAWAAKEFMEKNHLSGTVRYYGCPGEEYGSAKAFMARDGLFDDVDACFTWHPGTTNNVWLCSSLANLSVFFRFKGRTSHAASTPFLGRSALDACELMSMGVNYLREHIIPEARVHYAYVDVGGIAPNVVQDHAAVHYFIRAPRVHQMMEIYERVCDVARGAALMTGTQLEIQIHEGLSDYIPNPSLTKLMYQALTEVGAPEFDEEDRKLASAIRETFSPDQLKSYAEKYAGVPEMQQLIQQNAVLCDVVLPFIPESSPMGGSTDVGDASYCAPTAQINMCTEAMGTPGHTWQVTAQSCSSIAHKGTIKAAQVMALSGLYALEDPELLKKAKEELLQQNGGGYRCPMPPEIMPTL
ncbi:amidohydrolase [Ruminococcaceae bacterium AM07-15]|nr:amidohydrolase [Ruminococcaceae bacterium AM07-15]